jgi:DNA adenine methylase
MITSIRQVKPFLKWAGGKGQLIDQIVTYLPTPLKEGKIKKYVEPFLGGGAMYFWLMEHFDFQHAYLYEINPSVVNCYQVIQKNVKKLVAELQSFEKEYLGGSDKDREKLFYQKRDEFNSLSGNKSVQSNLRHAALLIFLNKTCFNGLYRVNSKGEFNVPFGRYKNPTICNEKNLYAVNELLKKAEIIPEDFAKCRGHIDNKTFVNLDMPLRSYVQL